MRTPRLFLAFCLLAGCRQPAAPASVAPAPQAPPAPASAPASAPPVTPVTPVVLSVIGTSDLHGHLEMLPVLGGYLTNVRKAREKDGALLLLDGGDMFQGTLESNLAEGAPVVAAYNALGYTAVTIGNHEFDYGPVGEAATPAGPEDDPRGALRARAAEARFPFLAANILDAATGAPPTWDNVRPHVLVEAAGVRVGLVGLSTEDTPHTTISANVRGLTMAPLAETIVSRAATLRAEGAQVVIVVAHAGGRCKSFTDAGDLTSCELDHEIFHVAKALPAGTVDLIVGGHVHAGVAHVVNGIPIIESYANGRAFGRVDLMVDRSTGKVITRRVFPPRDLCSKREGACQPGDYEGAAVVADPSIEKLLAPAVEQARARREERLGITLATPVRRAYGEESAFGNLVVDLMRKARPDADVAVTNGGGLRADLPAGPLTYGALFEALPFDNRFATVHLTGAQLTQLLTENLGRDGGILSVSGIRVRARCVGDVLAVEVARENGKKLRDNEKLTLVTSDFLATGGDGVFARLTRAKEVVVDESAPIREAVAAQLRKRGGTLEAKELFTEGRRRMVYPGERPVRCP